LTSLTSPELSTDELQDLIQGIPTDEFIEIYFENYGTDSYITLDSFMTLIYDNFDTPRLPHPHGFEYSDNSIRIYLDNHGIYWISNYSYIKDGEFLTPYELTIPSPPLQGPEDSNYNFPT